MNFEPMYDNIVIEPIEAEKVTKGGIHIPEPDHAKQYAEGTVVAVGPGRISSSVATGQGVGETISDLVPLRSKVGDVVVYRKMTEMPIKDDDGNFSHCYVTTQYESGFYLGIGLTGDYAINLVLSHQVWELPLGETYIISLSIDGKNLGLFESYSVDRKGLRIEIGNQQYIYKRLRFGRRLVVSAQKQDFYFSLKGTNKALTKVRECVRCFKIIDGKIE